MTSTPQKPCLPRPVDQSESPAIAFLECNVGGDRFGLPTSQVRHAAVWRGADLESLPESPTGIVGQTHWEGRWLPVIDLRQLLGQNPELDRADAQMCLMVGSHDDGLMLLIDGLIAIQCVPPARFQLLTSIDISDVRWFSGVVRTHEVVIPLLDVDALQVYCQRYFNRPEWVGADLMTPPLLEVGP